MSASAIGNVSDSRPAGFTRPSSTSAIAPPPAWPPSHASRIAGARDAHGMATAEPFVNTTTVFGWTSSTASTSAVWLAGRSMCARSTPSVSYDGGSPTQTTATPAPRAASCASRSSAGSGASSSAYPAA